MSASANPFDSRPIDPFRDGDAAQAIVRDSVLKLWDVVDNLTRLRPPHTDRYSVTIFGSARLRPEHPTYAEVRWLAERVARLGCRIVTGGGPGLMQAANEGAKAAHPDDPEASVGVRVDLAFEQSTNSFVGRAYEHRTFFSRLHHFVMLSNAFVVVDGGIGTLLEVAMVWQLLQVQKLYDTPLVLVGPMWAELVEWAARNMAAREPHLAAPVDMGIPRCVASVEEGVEIIRASRQRWLMNRSTEGI
jgi:predicted Rossmann-fold nucleotide-binding protein